MTPAASALHPKRLDSSPAASLRSVLLSNIPHYHYLAETLQAAGILERYVTSIALHSNHATRVPFLNSFWKAKLEGRRIRAVPDDKILQIRIPEVLQRALPRTGLLSSERSDCLNNYLFDLLAAMRTPRCDVFHFVSSVGLFSARRAKQQGATIICDVRQVHPDAHRDLMERETGQTGVPTRLPGQTYIAKVRDEFALADFFVVPSAYAAETFCAAGYLRDRIFVNPYGADLRLFQPLPRTDQRFRILFVGQVTVRKGVHHLLAAFRAARLPDSELLLIGSVDPAIRPLLARFEGMFRHVPSVPKTELARYYSDSSVVVLPSLTDAYPLVVLEAMACGIPVIVSENTGTRELVREHSAGFVLPVGDVEALADKLRWLFDHPGDRASMGARAALAARQNTWSEYGARALDIYEQIARWRLTNE